MKAAWVYLFIFNDNYFLWWGFSRIFFIKPFFHYRKEIFYKWEQINWKQTFGGSLNKITHKEVVKMSQSKLIFLSKNDDECVAAAGLCPPYCFDDLRQRETSTATATFIRLLQAELCFIHTFLFRFFSLGRF